MFFISPSSTMHCRAVLINLFRLGMQFTSAAHRSRFPQLDIECVSGEQAKEKGLVDSLGGLNEAIAKAKELAQVDEVRPTRLRNKAVRVARGLVRCALHC